MAAALNELGLEVWAHDHRGFGRSPGGRAQLPYADALIDDTKLVFDALASEAKGKGDTAPPVLLGHSMGGAIAARAVTGGWIAPRLLVLSSPGLKTHLRPFETVVVSMLAKIIPNVALPNNLPFDKISRDPAVVAEAKADPLNHQKITPRIASFIADAGAAAIRDAGNLTMQALVLAAGDDKLVDLAGSREFAARAPNGLCTLKIYDGMYHEIFNELEPDRARVLADLSTWVGEKLEC